MMQKMSSYYRPTDHRSFISSPDWAVMLQQQGYQGPKLQTIKYDNEFTHYNNQSACHTNTNTTTTAKKSRLLAVDLNTQPSTCGANALTHCATSAVGRVRVLK